MALINCPNCGELMSEKAVKCPNCGVNKIDLKLHSKVDKALAKTDIRAIFLIVASVCGIIMSILPIFTNIYQYGAGALNYVIEYNEMFYLAPLIIGLFGGAWGLWLTIKGIVNMSQKSIRYWVNACLVPVISAVIVFCLMYYGGYYIR